MLRGNAPAKIDDRGRLKMPAGFRSVIQQEHGRELFVTSLTGDSVRIYPMPVWLDVENRLAKMPSTHRADEISRSRELLRPAGRARPARPRADQPRLRESAQMTGEVDVLGIHNLVEVWNHERFLARLKGEPFTDADARALADFGI